MLDINELAKFISNKLFLGCNNYNCDNINITIHEKKLEKSHDSSSKCSKVSLNHFKTMPIAFILDKGCDCHVFSDKAKICKKGCDAVIFYAHCDKVYCFIIELKSNELKGYIQQMQSSKAIITYVLELYRLINNLNFEDLKIEYRYLLFHKVKYKGKLKDPVKYKKPTPESISGLKIYKLNCDDYCSIVDFIK